MFEMERLVEARITNNAIEVLVAWAGFEKEEWTWEPLQQLLEDRKQFVTCQLQNIRLSKLIKTMLARDYQIRA